MTELAESSQPPEPKSERERLDALHGIHQILLNPGHNHLITAHLARIHATGRRSQVLDVGTGTGAWAILLARQHPYTDVVGIDLYSFPTATPISTLSMSHKPYHGPRIPSAMVMDIPHYDSLIVRLSNILRPGGLLILVENELSYKTASGAPAEAVVLWSDLLRRALARKNRDLDLPRRLDEPIAATGMFSPMFYFQEIGCPVGGYMKDKSPALHTAGRIHATVLRASLECLVCSRVDPGPERQMLEALLDICAQELCAPASRYLQRLFAVYAYKKP